MQNNRFVDVTVRAKNETGPGFRNAEASARTFQNRLGGVAMQLSGLPGPLGRVTSALAQWTIGGGLMVAVLAGIAALSAAWDRVANRVNVVNERFKETGRLSRDAVVARLGMLEGREQNLAAGREATGGRAIDVSAPAGARRRRELQETRDLIAQYTQMLRELDQKAADEVAKRAREEAERRAKDLARDAAKFQEQERQRFEAGMSNARRFLDQGGTSSTSLSPEFRPPQMAPVADAAPLPIDNVNEMTVAVAELKDAIDILPDSITTFADTWAEATQEMILGSVSLGNALVRAGRRAVGGVLIAKGRETLLDAAKAAVQGFTNPAEFARAARLFAIGTAQTAAGQLFSGGGGGGGGGLGGGSFSQQQQEAGEGGEGTIIIQGGLLDVSDPRQADALADALNELRGRRVIIQGV